MIVPLSETHKHTQERLVTSLWKLEQTVDHLTSLIGVISSVRFHLATDDKPHASPPSRNKGDGDIVATETWNKILQHLHRA